MRCRSLLAMSMAVLTVSISSAGPLTGWTYTATAVPTGGAAAMRLDSGVRVEVDPVTFEEKSIPYTIIGYLNTTISGPVDLGMPVFVHRFADMDWEVYDGDGPSSVRPLGAGFTLSVLFTDPDGNTAVVSANGAAAAAPNFNGGTGQYEIALQQTRSFELGGRRFAVAFDDTPGESGTDIGFTVTAVSETPEPGTLILGGIALAGGVGAWLRRRKAA